MKHIREALRRAWDWTRHNKEVVFVVVVVLVLVILIRMLKFIFLNI